MYRETVNHLDRLARSVREGKEVHAAKDFCSWLQFSGFLRIFDYNPSTEKPFEVNPTALRKKLSDLLYDCGEWFRSNNISPKYSSSDISEINSKLDQLLAQKGDSSGLGMEPLEPLLVRTSARRKRAKGPQAGRTDAPRITVN